MTKLKIDKTNWKPVKFGDVVYEPKETAKDVVAENIAHVVGLEHIDSDDIHLRRSASIQESTTFTKKFAKGDVLFGRRRAYLRKAAQAEFEGICSGDITVFRAKPALSVRLLPFVVNNDAFFDYAITHSAGGLSPRVKFRDLADYEFLLPPPEEQEKLAELLWAMDEVIEREAETLNRCATLKKSYEQKNFIKYNSLSKDSLPINYAVKKLQELADISGGSTPFREEKTFWDGSIPWLTPTDVTAHNGIYLRNTKESITEEGLKSISNRLYPPGSILYCSRATIGYAVINEVPMATNQGFSNFICKNNISNLFLYFLLKHITPELIRLAGGSTFLEISKGAIRNYKVILPPENVRDEIESTLKYFEDLRILIESKIKNSKALQKSLINQIF